MKNADILSELKKINWDEILSIANSLDDLNDKQWRFLKAVIIEMALEKISKNELIYVAENHRDFIWKKYNLSVELKTNVSATMYKKKRWWEKKKNYNIILSNSMGSNKKNVPEIADIIISIYGDGVFFIDKKTAIQNIKKNGDGFIITVDSSDIVAVTTKKNVVKKTNTFKKTIMEQIKKII